MIKTRIHSPYLTKGGKEKTFFSDRFTSGVYIVYEGKKIVYVGFSGSNLYRTMYRHFQSWGTSRQYRALFNRNKHKVRVIYCSPQKAWDLEKALIMKHKPKFNENVYDMFEPDNRELKVYQEFWETECSHVKEYQNETPF